MDRKPHWTKIKVSRVPVNAADNPPEYAGDDHLSELSWFKRGLPSNRWPARFTDDAGKEIKSAEEIDWTGFNTMEGYEAEIRFNAKAEEAVINGLRRKP